MKDTYYVFQYRVQYNDSIATQLEPFLKELYRTEVVYTKHRVVANAFYQELLMGDTFYANRAYNIIFHLEDELDVWNRDLDLDSDQLTTFSSSIHSNQQMITTEHQLERYYTDWMNRAKEYQRQYPVQFILPLLLIPFVQSDEIVEGLYQFFVWLQSYHKSYQKAPMLNGFGYFELLLVTNRLDLVSLFYAFDKGVIEPCTPLQ